MKLAFLILAAATLPFTAIPSRACDVNVTKTELLLGNSNFHDNLCLEDYFQQRDLGRMSLGEDPHNGSPYIFRDMIQLSFDEMFLFSLPTSMPLGTEGRIKLAKRAYAAYMNSLRNDFGMCQLDLKADGRSITIDDFKATERSEADQPGSRIMLTKDDVKSPSWQLLCPDGKGATKVEKSGDYFFVFVDIYDNMAPLDLKYNLGRYLFSFR